MIYSLYFRDRYLKFQSKLLFNLCPFLTYIWYVLRVVMYDVMQLKIKRGAFTFLSLHFVSTSEINVFVVF